MLPFMTYGCERNLLFLGRMQPKLQLPENWNKMHREEMLCPSSGWIKLAQGAFSGSCCEHGVSIKVVLHGDKFVTARKTHEILEWR
jgi:hypothetical protein